MIKQVYFLILFTCFFAQTDTLSKAIYVGVGVGTNIGGVVGIGFEKEIVKGLSLSIAIGSIHPMLEEKTKFSKFSYDFGIKYYVFKGLFLGANYGFVDYQISTLIIDNVILNDTEEKYNGFTVSLGCKFNVIKQLNLSIFIANWLDSEKKSTGRKMTDDIVKKYDSSIRFGLMLGYNL